MKSIQQIKVVAFIILISISLSALNNRSMVPLDGFNIYSYDSSMYLFNSNMGLQFGSLADSFYNASSEGANVNSEGSFQGVFLSGKLGSESGDLLFNKYENSSISGENRDHETAFLAATTIPKVPVTIIYKYRYLDTYSDRFDSLWTDYENLTGQSMPYSNEGLSHEHLASLRYQSNGVLLQSVYNWYGRWGATPYYFSPIFTKGYSVAPLLTYNNNSFTFSGRCEFDNYSIYYDPAIPTELSNLKVKITTGLEFPYSLKGTAKISYDNNLLPRSSLDIGLQKSYITCNLGVAASFFSDYHVDFRGYGMYKVNRNVACSIAVGHDYLQAEKEFSFKVNNRKVYYKTVKAYQNNVYGVVTYTDTLFSPLKIFLWYQYCSDPLWESVSLDNSATYIEQMAMKNSAQKLTGINGSYSLSYKLLTFEISPQLQIPVIHSAMRFKLLKTAMIELRYSNKKSNPAEISVSIRCKDRASLSYPIRGDMGKLETFSSPAVRSVYFHIRLPFIPPLINSIIPGSAFVIDAGPLRISKVQRISEHPRGNRIGPAIYTGFQAVLK